MNRYCFRFAEGAAKKLFGVHPKTPGAGATSDACFDGEFQYTRVQLGAMDLEPSRGPILRLRVPVVDLLQSSARCGFCQIVVRLDTNGTMAKGRYEEAQVDIQLFKPVKYNGTWRRWVMQVALTLESEKSRTWQNSRLLALLPRSGKIPTSSTLLDRNTEMPNS